MKTINCSTILVCCIFFLTFNISNAQLPDSAFSFRNEIGIGVMRYSSDEFMFSLSANKVLKSNSELSLLLYGFLLDYRKLISASLAYNWALSKSNSRFNFYISPELNFHLEWRKTRTPETYALKYGPFFVVGFIPTYRISPRIKLGLDFKMGHGYLLDYNNQYYFQGKLHDYSEAGWSYTILPAVRVNYYFNK